MQITYNKMKEYFGIVYSQDSFFNLEQANICVSEQFNLDQSFMSNPTPNKEEAFSIMRKAIQDKKDESILKVDDTAKQFKTIGFREKMAWRVKNNKWDFATVAQERKADINKNAERLLNNITLREIDKEKTYKLNAPFLLKENTELYVVVVNVNVLDLGIYVAKAIDLEYTLNNSANNENLTIRGNLQIQANNQENLFSFTSEEDGFRSYHTYHHIFTDKEKALDFYKEEVKTRIESMQKRVTEFEATISSSQNQTAKPSMRM